MTYSDVPTRPQTTQVMFTRRRVPEWENANTWCESCEIHRATTNEPACPICLDDRKRKRQP